MPSFSLTSKERLKTCHPKLFMLFSEVVKDYDCAVLCGYRNYTDQEKAFSEGNSKEHFPNSKHNKNPSLAVDVAPYDTANKRIYQEQSKYVEFAYLVLGKAKELGLPIRWGGDWNMDGKWRDNKFFDGAHFELIGDEFK